MKKFTIKDFLLYACPCYGCRSPTSVFVGISYGNDAWDGSIRPIITQGHIRVDLKISYDSSLSIAMDLKTNRFATNSQSLFKKYLSDHKIYLKSHCVKCGTLFESKYLDFALDKGFALPFEIESEYFVLKSKLNIFNCSNSFTMNSCYVGVRRVDQINQSPIQMTLPLLPAYKFKDQQILLEKLKTYLLFS